MVKLSKRLEALAAMVTDGSRVCDVGCDHGWLSIALVQSGKSPAAIAMDINRGPLEAARGHVTACCLEDRIDLRLSDGLAGLKPGEADTVVIAGMGGNLIRRILENGKDVLQTVRELVLSPQSEVPAVRRYLRRNGWRILDETMVWEDGKYYFLMKAVPFTEENAIITAPGCEVIERTGSDGSSPESGEDEPALILEDEYGPVLMKTLPEPYRKWLKHERNVAASILQHLEAAADTPENTARSAALKKRLAEMEMIDHDG